jgi:DNA-binding NarL/FixJ family response regulator
VIKIILADDQRLLNESLKIIIEQDGDIEVAGLAENGQEALRLCDEVLPDLVLMDLKMPVCDGVKSTGYIKKKHPEIKVLILTTFNDDESVSQALKNGADGYILKNIKPYELREAIKSTVRGLNVIKEDVFSVLVRQLDAGSPMKYLNNPGHGLDFNEKEIRIIHQIVQGRSNKEIASSMALSEARIKSILSDIFIKLKIEDRIQLAVFAVKNHLC